MSIHLTITADSVDEFDTLLARFAKPSPVAAAAAAEQREVDAFNAVAAEPAPKGNARGRKPKDAPTAEATTAATAAGTVEATTDGTSTSTAPAETVDPFATTATPAATSPADQAAADAGEVTIQQLKDAMAELLKAKSASVAMQVLEQATGCKSLTSGSPNVVEKAKDDPSIMRRTLDALVAAKTAA